MRSMRSIGERRHAALGDTAEESAIPTRDDPLGGMAWVIVSMALFAVLATASRSAIALGYHPLQIVFLRNAAALVVMLPLLGWRGLSLCRSNAMSLYGVRVAISLASMTAWFVALSLIPLGEITAIGFLMPLFGTLGAIVLLGEKVRARRWTALMVGFAGAMIILRPGVSPLGVGQACAIFSALAGGIMAVLLKNLTATDDPDKIVFLTTAMLTPLSLVPAVFVWQWPGLELLPALTVIAITGVLGHAALMRGYRAADASLVMSLEFARLPFVVIMGYVMFGETIDGWTWLGAGIVFLSAVYISRREAQLRRLRTQRAKAEPPATG